MLGSVDNLLARLPALPGDDFLAAIIFALGFVDLTYHVQEACIRGNPPLREGRVRWQTVEGTGLAPEDAAHLRSSLPPSLPVPSVVITVVMG